MNKPHVFIAYSLSSEKERKWVRTFVETLTNHGVSVSWPESELAPGEHSEEAIAKGLRASDIIALIVTPESLTWPNTFFELGAAIGLGKRVVPILPAEMRSKDIPFPLRSRRCLIKKSPEKTALEFLDVTKPKDTIRQKKGAGV